MSDTNAENGSSTGGGGNDSPPRKSSINDKDLPNYATEKYVKQPEKYEQIAIGDCSSDANAVVENHSNKMKGEIKKTDEKIGG